jgi:subtilase family serine protease
VSAQAKLKHRRVCPPGQQKVPRCLSSVAVDETGKPLTFPKPNAYSLPGVNGTVWGFGPLDYHTAYNEPWKASLQQTIGIVLWRDDPTAKTDLDTFDAAFALGSFPSCTTLTTWSPCFAKVNQRGATTGPPSRTINGEDEETSLDVQYTHSTCLNCRIILVEADSNSYSNLAAAENMAYRLGATEINNSWGGSEPCPEVTTTYASAFNHPGVAIVASSGDHGLALCPADLNTVVSVGGTHLWENSDLSYSYETVFYDDQNFVGGVFAPGSGCSGNVGARSFQTSTLNWSQTGCGSRREVADVSASMGGAWVYDSSSGNNATTGNYWRLLYGTSLAAPIISGIYGVAGNGWSVYYPAQFAYQPPGSFHDVTSGSNGSCGTIMCQAVSGYDGPTGLGSPSGLGGF